jgi:hypothetical protein
VNKAILRASLVACVGLAAVGFAGVASAKSKSKSKSKAPITPAVSMTASAAAVGPGESVTLTWASTNTRACLAGGSWSGSKALSGSVTITDISQTSNFYLQCAGTKGGIAETTVWVALRAIDVAAVGNWDGYVDLPGGRVPLTAFIASDGRVNAFVNGGTINYWGVVKSAGASLTGGLYAAVPPGRSFTDGSTSGIGNFIATLQSPSEMSGTLTLILAGSETPARFTLYQNRQNARQSSISAIAGSYTFAWQPGVDSLNISSTGEVFGQNPANGCVANGAVALIDPAFGVYSMGVTYSNCVGSAARLNGTEFRGLAMSRNVESQEMLVFGLHGISGDSAYAGLYYYQRL